MGPCLREAWSSQDEKEVVSKDTEDRLAIGEGYQTAWQTIGEQSLGSQQDRKIHNHAEVSEADLDAILGQVRAYASKRRVRTKDFFIDFDNLRCGRCTRDQFYQGLRQIIPCTGFNTCEAFPLKPVQVAALARHFTESGRTVKEPQVVNYAKFCETIDDTFGPKRMETRAASEVAAPGTKIPYSQAGYDFEFEPLTREEEDRVSMIMKRIAVLSMSRGIDCDTCFTNLKHNGFEARHGKLAPEVFARCFPLAQSTSSREAAVSSEEMHLLARRYCTDSGDVNLSAFQRDIRDMQGLRVDAQVPVMSIGDPGLMLIRDRHLRHLDASFGNPLQSQLHSQLRLRPHSARVARSHEEQAFSARVVPTSWRPQSVAASCAAEDYPSELLESPVALGPQTSEISAFVQEHVTSPPGEAEPASPRSFVQEDRVPSAASRPRPRSAMAVRPHHQSTLVPAAPTTLRPQSARVMRPSSAQCPAKSSSVATQDVQPAIDVMAKLKAAVVKNRIRLRDMFNVSGSIWYNKGLCTRTHMQTAIALLGVQLSSQDYNQLFARFRVAEDLFCYRDCCDLLDEAVRSEMPIGGNGAIAARALGNRQRNVSQKHGVQDHHDVLEDTVPPKLEQQTRACELLDVANEDTREGQETELNEVIGTIRARISSRRIDIQTVIKNFSGGHGTAPGHVSRIQFARCMDTLGLSLSDKQLALLVRAFRDELGSNVNCLKFCNAVESVGSNPPFATAAKQHRPMYSSPFFGVAAPAKPPEPPRSQHGCRYKSEQAHLLQCQARPAGARRVRG